MVLRVVRWKTILRDKSIGRSRIRFVFPGDRIKNVLSCTWIVLTQSCHRQMYISWSHSSFFFSFLPPSSTPHLSSALHVHRLHRRRQRGAVFQPALTAFFIVRYTPSATKLSLTVYSSLQFLQVFPLFFSRHHPHSSLLFISFKH